MYLLEYNEQGQISVITVDPPRGLAGVYVNKLPMDLEELLERDLIEQIEPNKYKIKGVN